MKKAISTVLAVLILAMAAACQAKPVDADVSGGESSATESVASSESSESTEDAKSDSSAKTYEEMKALFIMEGTRSNESVTEGAFNYTISSEKYEDIIEFMEDGLKELDAKEDVKSNVAGMYSYVGTYADDLEINVNVLTVTDSEYMVSVAYDSADEDNENASIEVVEETETTTFNNTTTTTTTETKNTTGTTGTAGTTSTAGTAGTTNTTETKGTTGTTGTTSTAGTTDTNTTTTTTTTTTTKSGYSYNDMKKFFIMSGTRSGESYIEGAFNYTISAKYSDVVAFVKSGLNSIGAKSSAVTDIAGNYSYTGTYGNGREIMISVVSMGDNEVLVSVAYDV